MERVAAAPRILGAAMEPEQRAPFPSRGAVVVLADVQGGLEDERWQRHEVGDPPLAERLEHPPQGLLGDVLGGDPIAGAPQREEADPLPEAPDALALVHGRRLGGRPRRVTVAGDR
jgi:hypothetical protein